MNLKNYTSTVPPHTSMANIEKWLIEIGASSISKQYNEKKICSAITFLIYDKRTLKTISFNLKAHVEECYKILWESYSNVGQKRVDKTKVLDQANRTAWKILSDWVEIQCSMILLGQAEPLQMFLPYMYDMQENETFYEKIVSGKMPLQLAEQN